MNTNEVRDRYRYDGTGTANLIRQLCHDLDALRKPPEGVERPPLEDYLEEGPHDRMATEQIFYNYILALEAEIARLKAETDDDSPGTPLGIINSLCDYAEKNLGHNPASARHGVTTILETLEAQKAELAKLKAPVSAPRPDIEGLERLSEKARSHGLGSHEIHAGREFEHALRNAFPALAAYVRELEGRG